MNIKALKEEVSLLADQCKGRVGLVIETAEGRIDINHNEKFSAASLIKIPILIEGFRQYDNKLLDFHECLPLLPSNRVGGAGVLQALSEDLSLKIIDLMALMIIVSDNTATNVLIDRFGMDKINQCIQTLNLQGTKLNRKMMDFEAIKKGLDNYTTPSDVVNCLKLIDQGNFLTEDSSKQAIAILEKQQFKNKLCKMINVEAIQVASKTGELPGVEHDCAIMKYGGKTIYIAVLIDQLHHPEAGRQTLAQIGIFISQYLLQK